MSPDQEFLIFPRHLRLNDNINSYCTPYIFLQIHTYNWANLIHNTQNWSSDCINSNIGHCWMHTIPKYYVRFHYLTCLTFVWFNEVNDIVWKTECIILHPRSNFDPDRYGIIMFEYLTYTKAVKSRKCLLLQDKLFFFSVCGTAADRRHWYFDYDNQQANFFIV